MFVQSYRDLIVWQKSIFLVKEVYRITKQFVPSDLYGLASQMRRSAVSIPSNIAEGSRRRSLPDYIRFLNIANGSSAELETQLIIAQEIYPRISFKEIIDLSEEISKMLYGLIKNLTTKT